MSEVERPDEDVMEELLGSLRGDQPAVPANLPEKTIRKVRALISSTDLIDFATFVFIAQFCAPLIDLIAAMFGVETQAEDRRNDDE
jgi:hypothetical protein